jgi:hypothetical protein
VGAVAKVLGITIHPANNLDNSNPLESIARASGFRTRRVTLTSNWWKTDSGPLLGFMKADNLPIALHPSKPTNMKSFIRLNSLALL